MLRTMNRDLALLTACSGFLMINNVVFIAINGLVGLALAPVAWMATLPITAYVVGAALSTGIVARTQRRFGRKRSFQLGLVVAIGSAMLAAWAAVEREFVWLLVATLVAGFYNANGALYRFAAVELVPASAKEKALSLVLVGGILGAFVGPNLANHSRDWLGTPFAGAYAALIVVALLSLATISFIRFPALPVPEPGAPAGRSVREIARQPAFIVAVAGGALGYGVMNLLMSATPIAMDMSAHPFHRAALVLEWHVLGMFVPSLFTGHLIKRFGVLIIMGIGVLLNLLCIAIALSGVDVMHFLVALFLLGVGWNFLFVGGSTLLTETYRPQERTSAQAAMDFWVFTTMAVTSFASGALITTSGWQWLNVGSLLPVALVGLAVGWLALRRHQAARAA